MKLYCLSQDPNKSCLVLKYRGTTLMLDCGLDICTILNYLPIPLIPSSRLASLPTWKPKDQVIPQLDGVVRECCNRFFIDGEPEFGTPQDGIIDVSDIDAVLISNYLSMLALPFVTESPGFRGAVYATEPTLQMGRYLCSQYITEVCLLAEIHSCLFSPSCYIPMTRLFMEEIQEYLEGSSKHNDKDGSWKDFVHLLPLPFNQMGFQVHSWKKLYSRGVLNASLAKIQIAGFSQSLDVFGALKVSPVSSGFCLGSCNWLITCSHEKVVYVSGSSTLTTHPRSIDQASLKNADVLILTGLTQTPASNPDAMLGDFCMTVALTVKNGGSVLVPCYPSGVTYDLFECLSSHLETSSLSHIPMYFISPVADSSLAYSNIFAEWLSQSKQSRVYLPEEPFPHAHLVKTGRLKPFRSVEDETLNADFRQPCIMFCGHPSLRFGAAVHFTMLWGSNPANTIVFTEPDFNYLEALAPFQPLALKCVHCPIDTCLSFSQANKLVRDLRPGNLIVPAQYLQPPLLHPQTDFVINAPSSGSVVGFRPLEVVKVQVGKGKDGWEAGELDPRLAKDLKMCQVKPGVQVATITALLDVKDNRYSIRALPQKLGEDQTSSLEAGMNNKPKFYPWGPLDITSLVQKLTQEGIVNAKVEETASGYIVLLQNEDTVIQIEEKRTHIFCEDDARSDLRAKLNRIIMSSLNKF
ncbi:unnamed protein product [Darwinula stevensoni]|uniref:Beta-Casp domain-containing protein n=1 Tax=Darwinula stevensoni TaxID=69355 RepID=A0A7R8XKK2_9CRUS|nr:unnamed protein product [Darwinula stevensoni]CAG0893257.1 unnamed protein product [Darwinula stevensoni]